MRSVLSPTPPWFSKSCLTSHNLFNYWRISYCQISNFLTPSKTCHSLLHVPGSTSELSVRNALRANINSFISQVILSNGWRTLDSPPRLEASGSSHRRTRCQTSARITMASTQVPPETAYFFRPTSISRRASWGAGTSLQEEYPSNWHHYAAMLFVMCDGPAIFKS